MRYGFRLALALLFLTCASPMAGDAASAVGLSPSISTTSGQPSLLYIADGHLQIRSVSGGASRTVGTPWPMRATAAGTPGFTWAPDGLRVALDDAKSRLAVVNLTNGRITVLIGRRCGGNCSPAVYAWSPNGRYLAIVQPITRNRTVLRVWDSAIGRMRSLLANLAPYVAYPEWSHDSTRIAVQTGTFDTVKNVYPEAVIVNLSGGVSRLGKGQYVTWSPDDRYVGIIRPNMCGANTCDEDVLVRSSRGGPAIMLFRHSSSLFDNPVWASRPNGYAFDHWILNASGVPVRSIVSGHARVLSWKPDGSRVAWQTYYPYQGTPDTLFVAAPVGRRVRLYTDGPNAGCGACSKDVYGVFWGHGTAFAFLTPTYPTPQNVTIYPKFFLSSIDGASLTRIPIPGHDIANILGFVNGDTAVIIRSGGTVYRYTVATRGITAIATGLAPGYSTAVLDPRVAGQPQP